MSDGKPAAAAAVENQEPDAAALFEALVATPADPRTLKPRNDFERSADYANYFITYGFLCHQKQMLEDQHRMHSYHRAIKQNESVFKDKVVLDLGTGTGVLAIWAAQAGARKVYAVEATPMAHFAEKLVKANGLDHIVTVIQGKIEDLPVPEEKVDIMVSEWMGYFLLRESMLDSVIYAREKWMVEKPTLFPSHATIYVAPVVTNDTEGAVRDLEREVHGWEDFVGRTKDMYDFDLAGVQEDFLREQRVYHLQTVQWRDIPASSVVGTEAAVLSLDLNTCSVEDYASFTSEFECLVKSTATATALAGWFETEFNGSATLPCKTRVRLTTAPSPQGHGTHWGQQLFYLHPAVACQAGDRITGKMTMVRNVYNHRLLDFDVDYKVLRAGGAVEGEQSIRYVLE